MVLGCVERVATVGVTGPGIAVGEGPLAVGDAKSVHQIAGEFGARSDGGRGRSGRHEDR